MRRLIRAGAVVTAAAVLVVAAGGVASAKTVPDKKYVKAVCASSHGIGEAGTTAFDGFNAAINEYNTSPSADATTFHNKVVALVDEFISTVESLEAKMKKLSPEDGGKKITKTFDGAFKEILSKLNEAADKFRAADPNGVAYQGDVIQLQTALQILDVGLTDPFTKIDDQDLIDAFDNEKSCDDVVTVIGG